MKYQDGIYSNPANGVYYTHAPAYYEAIAMSSNEAVARLVQAGNTLVYGIKGIDENKMLCTEYYNVLCAVDHKLPEKLADFKPNKAHICKTIELSYSVATLQRAEELASVVSLLESGAGFDYQDIYNEPKKERYDIKFESSEHKGLYYCLTYWRYSSDVLVYKQISDPNNFEPAYPGVEVTTEQYEGEWYAVYHFGKEILHDRVNGKCYAVGDAFSKYLTDDQEAA